MPERGKNQHQPFREIIYERMDILLSLAAQALKSGDEKYAKRYIFLARKLSSRYNCRFTPKQKTRFCKGCGMPRVLGLNTKVRLRKRTKSADYICSCGRVAKLKYDVKNTTPNG